MQQKEYSLIQIFLQKNESQLHLPDHRHAFSKQVCLQQCKEDQRMLRQPQLPNIRPLFYEIKERISTPITISELNKEEKMKEREGGREKGRDENWKIPCHGILMLLRLSQTVTNSTKCGAKTFYIQQACKVNSIQLKCRKRVKY